MSRHQMKWTALTCLSAAVLIGGCHDTSHSTYGSGMTDPSAVPTPSMTPPAVVVPAGATPLASGTFNQITFTVPAESGQLFIFDQETNGVVGSTNSVSTNAGRTMTMADLKNTTQGLNMTDHYRIYFAPTHPTTAPIGGGSGM